MGGKSAPAAPDYRAAAEQQAAGSERVTNIQTWANRPNQYSPFGAITWNTSPYRDPGTGQTVTQWNQNISLSPQLQQALDAQQRIQGGRSNLAETLLSRAQDEYGRPIQFGQTPLARTPQADAKTRQRAEEAYYSRLSSRLDPMWRQRQRQMEAQLGSQGLSYGDKAYTEAMRELNRSRTDAYQQAQDQSILAGGGEMQRQFGMQMAAANYQNQLRQQEISEELQRRGYSLNEINAILTGQQVGLPSMPNFAQASRAEGPQYLQAAQYQGQSALDAFNAEQAALQGMMSGVSGFLPW